jgi:excisionase family DNA binding protein
MLISSEHQIPGQEGRFAFSIPEVCAKTGLGRDAVYRAISGGQLVARKLGKRTIVNARDLERFLHNLPRATPTFLVPFLVRCAAT